MGFDKPGENAFKIPVSDTQAYRQFGNAVVVPVVEAVARLMQPYIVIPSKNAIPSVAMDLPNMAQCQCEEIPHCVRDDVL